MLIADLHIHSKYSRATSRDGDVPHLDLWARYKGIDIVGTGDFTHPAWRQELKDALEHAEEGLYRLRPDLRLPGEVAGPQREPRFVVSGEISTIYKKDGKTRKVHHVLLLPGLEEAERLAERLEAIGNIRSDGRPILGLDSHDLLEIVLETCPQAVYIPAHIWTPHFSLFGAFSGFDSVEECYGDLARYVHAMETGLSSDPPMNRRCSMLDGYQLVSNSDAHSPAKLGREATLLSGEKSFSGICRAVETGQGLEGTIEFFPEEGKYHLDGHRACGCCLEPSRTMELGGVCPVCGRKLTIGVAHRVEVLADRTEQAAVCSRPYESLMPLPELLADCMGASPSSKRVQAAYFDLLKKLGPEFDILRTRPLEEVGRTAGRAAEEALRRLRAGQVLRRAGYDGEYGVITLFAPHELELFGGQTALLDLLDLPGPRRKTQPEPGPLPESGQQPEPQPQPAQPAGETAGLNPQQRQAVETNARAVAVIAGPGTGKTRTLVARIAWLIREKKVPASQITAVTFTRQAAEEMRQRLAQELGGKKALRGLNVGTFHALCLQLLDKKPLVGGEQAAQWVAEWLRQQGLKRSAAECQRLLSAQKNGQEVEGLPEGLAEDYAQWLAENGMRDLDDLLLDALEVEVDGVRAFRHLLVDEFQDINAVQRALVRHWSAQAETLFVIGDPDQSIYGFRGADAGCFDALARETEGLLVLHLTENYRSAPAVLRSAQAVIDRNPGAPRALYAHRPEGAPVRTLRAPDARSEGIWIAKEIARMVGGMGMVEAHGGAQRTGTMRAFGDIAVLCRTHRQLEEVERCLRHDSIPCLISGRGDFLAAPAVRGLTGFFRALLRHQDRAALHDALTLLWQVPTASAYALEAAWAQLDAPDVEALRLRLTSESDSLCAPWCEAAQALLPRVEKEKPRRLLEDLASKTGVEKQKDVLALAQTAALFDSMDAMLQALLLGEEGDIRRLAGAHYASGAVRLMTLHGAKGLEFPVVFLAGAARGELPLEREGRPTDLLEERRLFFVGMTRAKEELILTCGGEPSPFLSELPGEVERVEIPAYKKEAAVEQLSLF